MTGRKFSSGSGYRYGFNGKENDNEVKGEGGQQDYGMRIYDPRLGKFLSVDPIAKDFPWNSSYAFAENDVIRSIDLDGLEKVVYTFIKNEDGSWLQTQLQLPKPGPLGNGALVKFKNDKIEAYYYGSEMPANSTGRDFTKAYEHTNKDKEGNHKAYKIPGESFTTIGYGHANQGIEDAKKYPIGTKISESEANALFEKDYTQRDVTGNLPKYQIAAINDFSFNTTDDARKTVNRWNSATPAERESFFVDNIRSKNPSHQYGLGRRRSAEQILYSFGKYVKIDFSRSAQAIWKKVYDQNVDSTGNQKKEKDVSTKD